MDNGARKYVVITGASSGIGYQAAKVFARRGKNLVIAARRRDRLEQLKGELRQRYPGLDVVIREMDLSVPENVPEFYEGLAGYPLETWINNAGFGCYSNIADQDLEKIRRMLRLHVEAVTVLSTLFVRDYRDTPGTQLINVSSCGGYTIVPGAVTYCASKFYIGAFTEGLARELAAMGSPLRAKVLAPAATKTEFGKIANGVEEYDYDQRFGAYHTSRQVAEFLLRLYDSDKTVGLVDRETLRFRLCDPLFPDAWASARNQKN